MALRDFGYLLYFDTVRLLVSVVIPIGMIYTMLVLQVWFWPFLFSLLAVLYLLARHYSDGKPRRRWKWWEPSRDRTLKRW